MELIQLEAEAEVAALELGNLTADAEALAESALRKEVRADEAGAALDQARLAGASPRELEELEEAEAEAVAEWATARTAADRAREAVSGQTNLLTWLNDRHVVVESVLIGRGLHAASALGCSPQGSTTATTNPTGSTVANGGCQSGSSLGNRPSLSVDSFGMCPTAPLVGGGPGTQPRPDELIGGQGLPEQGLPGGGRLGQFYGPAPHKVYIAKFENLSMAGLASFTTCGGGANPKSAEDLLAAAAAADVDYLRRGTTIIIAADGVPRFLDRLDDGQITVVPAEPIQTKFVSADEVITTMNRPELITSVGVQTAPEAVAGLGLKDRLNLPVVALRAADKDLLAGATSADLMGMRPGARQIVPPGVLLAVDVNPSAPFLDELSGDQFDALDIDDPADRAAAGGSTTGPNGTPGSTTATDGTGSTTGSNPTSSTTVDTKANTTTAKPPGTTATSATTTVVTTATTSAHGTTSTTRQVTTEPTTTTTATSSTGSLVIVPPSTFYFPSTTFYFPSTTFYFPSTTFYFPSTTSRFPPFQTTTIPVVPLPPPGPPGGGRSADGSGSR